MINYDKITDIFCITDDFCNDFEKITSMPMSNFISGYLTNKKDSTRKEAIQHWLELKNLSKKRLSVE
uniref:hypothetical protein n=1 Tax=Ornithobacterium rhinotracheale TaxID=28251 RepID=UPI0039A5FB24